MLPDVKINKSSGGLGRVKPTEDGISGLISQGVAVGGKLDLNKTYELHSLKEAEAIGITAAYDTTNTAKLYFHISEFYRMNPGATLFLRVVARTVTMAQMADKALAHAKQLLTDANGKIKQLGFVLDPAGGYVVTVVDGMDGDVVAAIDKAEALAAEEFEAHRPVSIYLGGSGVSSVAALADLRLEASPNVAVVIGTDHLTKAGVPAIGTFLGTISRALVHENIGWLDKFPLSSDGRFLTAGLSDGTALTAKLASELETLNNKGYIFALQHTGFNGWFWNDSHTCTGLDSDYAYIENNRTLNKAARVIRQSLLPSLKGPLPVDGDGKLLTEVIGNLEAKAESALQAQMSRNGEISALDVYIDPDQDVIATSKLEVKFNIVPVGVARQISGTIGLVKSLNS